MEEQQERIVKGIWIPIEVWKDQNLTWNEKILLLEIDSYSSQDKDCFISNKHISELLDINETNASKTLSSLVEKGYVIRTRFDGKHRFVKSALSQTTTLPCHERQPSHVRTSKDTIHSNSVDITNTTYQEKETDKSVSKKKGALDMSIVAPEMQEVVETWLAYKKEKGQSYKPSGFISFYKRICELSNNNPQIAMAIVEQSKSNNYSGIFPLKTNNNLYGTRTQSEKLRDTVIHANEYSKMLHDRIEQQATMGDGDSEEIRRLQDIF